MSLLYGTFSRDKKDQHVYVSADGVFRHRSAFTGKQCARQVSVRKTARGYFWFCAEHGLLDGPVPASEEPK